MHHHVHHLVHHASNTAFNNGAILLLVLLFIGALAYTSRNQGK